MPQLREYQESAIARLDDYTSKGVQAPLLVAPTGSGKTVIMSAIVERNPSQRFLILVPRRELVHQTCRKLDDVGVRHGVILAGDNRLNLYARVQVASRDTLIARLLRKEKYKLTDFDRVLIDEAHIGMSARFQQLIGLWPNAQRIGFTATPCRSDGKALGQVYDELIEVSNYAELTKLGFLVPARYFSVSEPDLKKVRTTAGDFNQGDLDKVMNRSELVGDIVEHWMKHAASRRTVVFATSIEHSVALATEFIEHGVSAEHVDAMTPQSEREAIFHRFQNGITQVLTNCTLASVGFDLPELDCVVFARPTKSLGLYLQMLGRGLRPAGGKQDCLVLDHAGNVHRHGFATDERYWTLHGKYALDASRTKEAKKKKEAEQGIVAITCPQCKCVWEGSNQCPSCGYYFQQKAKGVETRNGQLVEIGKSKVESPESKMRFFLELAGLGEMKDYKSGWAANQYKERFGEWPEWKWKNHVDKFGGMDPSIETIRWVKSRMIRYSKAIKKAQVHQPAEPRLALTDAPY
jgi:DNA repair protein RadD